MIISLRGTSGSGKSRVVFDIFNKFPASVVQWDEKERPLVYQVKLKPRGKPLFILGRYSTACGGTDTMKSVSTELPPLIRAYAPQGHVLFEGLLVSGMYSTVGMLAEEFGKDYVFAFLDTPLETCLERVNRRRAARGKMEPVNPKNTEQKYKATLGVRRRVLEMGHRCVDIKHKHATKEILELLGV